MDVLKKLSFEVQGICETILDYSNEPYLRNLTTNLSTSVKHKNIEDISYIMGELKNWYARNQYKIQSNEFVYDKYIHIEIQTKIDQYIKDLQEYKLLLSDSVETEVGIGQKIFISHSSKDEFICTAFVDLLESVGVPEEFILYSSSSRHGIPGDKDIFDYLRKHIAEGINVYYMLSDNYYESVYCQNEMGAAWIAQNDFSIFLLPNFSGNIKGVIDSNRKGFTILNPIELTQLKNKIVQKYDLTISEMKWEEVKNRFIQKIKGTF